MFDYHFEGEENLDSPALVYYEDLIEENIKKAVDMAGSAERMWPHVKTYKTVAMLRLLQARGITRFKSATIAEAEMCARCGASDILVSYPLVGPAIDRFIQLQRRYAASTFWAIGDNLGQLSLLGEAASAAGFNIPLLIDVNSGMNRTGVDFEGLEDFCLKTGAIPGLALKGFHCYDGHMGISDIAEREKAVDEEMAKLISVRNELYAKGLELPVIVMGGTPTFPLHARNKGFFLSPGTIFVNDHGYDAKFKDLRFTPGAAILTRVISRPKPDLFTLDLGSKAISTDNEVRGVITELSEAKPVKQSEEHYVFSMEGSCPPIGTVLYVIPTHICPTTALYPGVYVVRDRKLVNYWEIDARDRKITV
jgi:D-serine deaminase-like pyridoxal phosphate-dependent protein